MDERNYEGGPLRWIDRRWHCYDPRRGEWRGIHAGESLHVRMSDGTWLLLRIESSEGGRILTGHYDALSHVRFNCKTTIFLPVESDPKCPACEGKPSRFFPEECPACNGFRGDVMRWPLEEDR